jgi:hypothetical protein
MSLASDYYTDVIKYIDITTNEYGGKTETETQVNCRVEDFNEIINDATGSEVMADMIVFTDVADFNPSFGDYLMIITKAGRAYEQPNKKWQVKKKSITHGFDESHIEVYI